MDIGMLHGIETQSVPYFSLTLDDLLHDTVLPTDNYLILGKQSGVSWPIPKALAKNVRVVHNHPIIHAGDKYYVDAALSVGLRWTGRSVEVHVEQMKDLATAYVTQSRSMTIAAYDRFVDIPIPWGQVVDIETFYGRVALKLPSLPK